MLKSSYKERNQQSLTRMREGGVKNMQSIDYEDEFINLSLQVSFSLNTKSLRHLYKILALSLVEKDEVN